VSVTRYELKAVASPKRLEIVGMVVAGRSPESDLVLTDGNPSRRHAQLLVSEGKVWIEDLGSMNGTYVNGRPIKVRTALLPGDRVRFDEEEFELRAIPPPDDAATQLKPRGDSDGHQTVLAHNRARTPGSWADPDFQDAQRTRLLDPAELAKMRAAGATALGPVDAPYLVVQSGRRAGERLKLKSGRETNVWEIGSDAGHDIVLDDSGVSGFHAKLVNEGSRWKLIDQMSANGSFVNGQKSNISYLKHGDRLRFGPVECVFQLPEVQGRGRSSMRMSGWMIGAIAFAITAGAIIGAILVFS